MWYSEEGTGGAAANPGPSSLAVPNVTLTHQPACTDQRVLKYNGLLLCGFNLLSRVSVIILYSDGSLKTGSLADIIDCNLSKDCQIIKNFDRNTS